MRYKDFLFHLNGRNTSSWDFLSDNIFKINILKSKHTCAKKGQVLFCKRTKKKIHKQTNNQKQKNTLILPKISLKLTSTCSSFLLTTYLLCLVDMFFNRQSAYIRLWVQTVLLFLPTCSFNIRMRQTSYRGFSRKTKRRQPDPLISRSAIQMMSLKFH